MLIVPFPANRRRIGVLAAAFACLAAPSAAADASPWHKGAQSAVRLVAGQPSATAEARIQRAGVEIRLDPGWKTYWRYPGDSGVPPRFDFSASSNVAKVSVMWPAPVRFSDAGGTSIGYAERALFPLHIVPQDARAPTVLRLKLDYAVCEKLCVPDVAQVEMSLPPTSGTAHNDMLAASEARVPVRSAIGAPGPLAIASVREDGGEQPRVVVDVRAPEGAAVDLFAEGPTPDWSLPLPEPIAGAPKGMQRFAFKLDGLPPGAKPQGAALTLTAVTASHAIEVVAHLD